MAEESKEVTEEVKEGLFTKVGKATDKMFGGLGDWNKKHWKTLAGVGAGAVAAGGLGLYFGKKSADDAACAAIEDPNVIDADSTTVDDIPTESD